MARHSSPSLVRAAAVCAGVALLAPLASAQKLKTVLAVDGLDLPLYLTSPPGDTQRLYVLEQDTARIRVVDGGGLRPAPFLDLGAIASQGGERGLLGMAFHPNYASNKFFFVNYTNNAGATVVARYTAVDANTADAASARTVITIAQPFSNHNGGMIAFGPDGYLYVGMGDGGDANDPGDRAQNTGDLLGKMLRLDIDGDDFPADNNKNYAIPLDNPFRGAGNPLDEIWAIGTRNPWRFNFDRETGDMWIADVGQGSWEEIDFQPANSTGGENYGWDVMEGNHCRTSEYPNCNPALYEPAIFEYSHGGFPNFRCSISGGYVYRGSDIPGLQGTYFYADYCSNQIWSLRYDGATVTEQMERTSELRPSAGSITSIVSFGEDAEGELYIVDQNDGEIWKIVGNLMSLTVPTLTGGQNATVTVNGASSNATVYYVYSLTGTGVTRVAGLNVSLGLASPALAGQDQATSGGLSQLAATVPVALSGRTLWVQAAENGNTSNVVQTTVL